ncbi:MAG TPA: DsrE family protein [Casimicrobiaceae bacterium]|nr:DsrE family protein [Casimicrobiaceae bacterium]
MTTRSLAGALAALALCLLAGIATPASAQPVPQRNRIVIQVSDGDAAKWNLALNNARNLQADLGAANVEIEIVAYGPGIGMLKRDSPVASRIAQASDSGVKVVACENTMKGQQLAKSDMLADIGFVGAGVVEIMQRQQEGWAYLRP